MRLSSIECQVRSRGVTLSEFDTEYSGRQSGKSYIISQDEQVR